MKVAIILPGFSSNERDWCIPALLNLVRYLASRVEVHVFALRYPHRLDRYSVYGATVHSLNGAGAGSWRSPALWTQAVRAIAEENRRGAFDVLHAFWAYEPGPLAVWAGRRLGLPVVVSLAGGELARMPDIGYGLQLWPHRRALIGWALRNAAVVTAGSRYFRKRAEQLVPRVEYLPLGVDTSMFYPILSPPFPLREEGTGGLGPPTILNIASLSPVKDHPTLLRSFAEVKAEIPDLKLVIVGGDPENRRGPLEQLCRELEVEEAAQFIGEVPHDELPGLYRSAQLCVQSSRHEAQGLAVLEAAACGVPTAGTAVGILPELVGAEWLAPPGDASALAGLIRRGINRPEHLREIGQRLRAKVEKVYGVAAAGERFLSLYRATSEHQIRE